MDVLIRRDQLSERVAEMAGELDRIYSDSRPVVIGILGSAFVFLADLIRGGDFASQIDFIWLESYDGTRSTGRIRVKKDFSVDVQGKDVLIVDDIVDTGATLRFIRKHVLDRGARSIKSVVLLRKNRAEADPFLAELIGFTIPDAFVFGYGMDCNGRFRHLPDLHRLAPGEEKP